MNIVACTSPLQTGRIDNNLQWFRSHHDEIMSREPDLIVMAQNSLTGFVSDTLLRDTDFQSKLDAALCELATFFSVPLIGSQDQWLHGQRKHRPLYFENGKATELDFATISCERQTVYIRADENDPFPNDLPVIDLFSQPATLSAPAYHNSIRIDALTVADCGGYFEPHTGFLHCGETCHGGWQQGIYTITLTANGWRTSAPTTYAWKQMDLLRWQLQTILQTLSLRDVVIGLSGGIDSTVNALLYQSVVEKDHILGVTMPSSYTSSVTRSIAKQLAKNSGISLLTVPIKESVEATRTQLETIAKATGVSLSLDGLPYENLQARDRTSRVLATIASARGAIFTCNANKTETTVGYGTMYGDIAGALAATADLWKHEVYELSKDLDDFMGGGIIPREVFTVPPSAELSSAQDVTKGFGDPLIYPYHDYLFASWIQDTPLSLAEILECYEEHTLTKRLGATVEVETLFADADAFVADLERWWTLYRGLSIAKRVQAPPILAAGPYPFGKYREAQGEPRYSDRYLAKRKKLLKK